MAPDPVALEQVFGPVFFHDGLAAIVVFIAADGVEQEFSIRRAPVFSRLAADDIARDRCHELRRERIERFGIFTVRHPVAVESEDNPGLIGFRLAASHAPAGTGVARDREGRQQQVRTPSISQSPLEIAVDRVGVVRNDDLAWPVKNRQVLL